MSLFNKGLIVVGVCLMSLCLAAKPAVSMKTISSDPIEISAGHFEVDVSSNVMTAQKTVIIKQGALRIKADKAVYTDQNEDMKLYGNVLSTFKQLTINCQVMTWQRNKKVVFAQDHLSVIFDIFNVTAEKLRYEVKKNIIYFEGKTLVRQNKNVITGKDIVLDMAKKKIFSTEKTHVVLEGLK